MKSLKIPFQPLISATTPVEEVAQQMNYLKKNSMEIVPWPEYSYKPEVSFTLTYGKDSVFLKYYVREKYIKAICTKTNDPVYNDSCVEFFIAFDLDNNYYNFEFNCLGTCLAEFGSSKEQRQKLPAAIIEKIKHLSLIKTERTSANPSVYWELTLVIPFEVFKYHRLTTLKSRYARVNFYKCGDGLPDPHYVSWTNIDTADPDFHLPEFFGNALFDPAEKHQVNLS
jgi:hypothetical protein